MSEAREVIAAIPELTAILAGADHVDIKTVEGEIGLREFIAGMLSHQPGWVTALYHVRKVFVRLLGMRQPGVPTAPRMQPAEVPFTVGAPAAFFTVRAAAEERYWFAGIDERHLGAHLGVVVEPVGGGRRRFHVVTVVHYRNWAGPVYFNIIRPFHHLVVRGMARRGVCPAK